MVVTEQEVLLDQYLLPQVVVQEKADKQDYVEVLVKLEDQVEAVRLDIQEDAVHQVKEMLVVMEMLAVMVLVVAAEVLVQLVELVVVQMAVLDYNIP
jgi:hypothetical protein